MWVVQFSHSYEAWYFLKTMRVTHRGYVQTETQYEAVERKKLGNTSHLVIVSPHNLDISCNRSEVIKGLFVANISCRDDLLNLSRNLQENVKGIRSEQLEFGFCSVHGVCKG